MSANTVKPISRRLVHYLLRVILASALVLSVSVMLAAQTLKLQISVTSTQPARIAIATEFPEAINVLSFPNAYANVFGLAERIESVHAESGGGEAFKKLATGEFQASTKFKRVVYEVDLSSPLEPKQESHVSSLNSTRGVLMLADLLPRSLKGSGAFSSALVKINLPRGWRVASNSQKQDETTFTTNNPEDAVFVLSSSLKEKSREAGTQSFSVAVVGDWSISEKDILKVGSRIVEEYSKLTSFQLKNDSFLMLVPYAGAVGPERWTAETRGNCVLLFLGNQGNQKQVKSKLSVILAHELFHLWLPNSMDLKGDYDWFFEGFTIYRALRTDLRLHFISFEDYLDTIARVFDSYLAAPEREDWSLLDASEHRWTASSSLVYDKAMLVAFLYDLQLLSRSNCGKSFDGLYRTLFAGSSKGQADANETIINLLNAELGDPAFVRKYVQGVDPIELGSALAPFAIEVSQNSSGTKLSVGRTNTAQKKLLKCLERH